MSTENDTKTPAEWCQIEGVQILDPDGWRGHNGRPWTDPISLAEFRERLTTCTQRSVTPQPAGEHHTGTLNLAGQGNAPSTPISVDLVVDATKAGHQLTDDEWHGMSDSAREYALTGVRRALEAAYPAIRQHLAEEIATALDAVPGEVYPEDIFPPDGTSVDCHSARVMRVAYPAAANIAREIGVQA